MSLHELETAVAQLPARDLTAFAQWFEAHFADVWDCRLEGDILAGQLDEAGRCADVEFESGQCRLR